MTATINEIFETGRMMICFDDDSSNYPTSIADMKKCENVLVGSRIDGSRSPYEAIIDDKIVFIMPLTIEHPSGAGRMVILETF